ncbi:hypothetical protein ASF87_16710 [Microbacterium sp. Leaf161]|uniref:hypothetical protein n=1 Tax=Microbacterium sp. Leaf161 TaxID=1736281 RepID=UPI0006FDE63E|nr:hypothetical protein [Microbacterium sp. Leaf161]KQR43431.1 hypothetical protein ASF87_16710 [Microbacterium sp. Leaf161]
MFSDLPAFRSELRDRLVAALPDEWEIVKDLMAANVSLVPAVYIEFNKFDTTFNGEALGHGQVSATADLVLADPRTADVVAEQAIEDEVVLLIRELDKSSDIGWSTATKFRLDSGPLAWRISTIALVTI